MIQSGLLSFIGILVILLKIFFSIQGNWGIGIYDISQFYRVCI